MLSFNVVLFVIDEERLFVIGAQAALGSTELLTARIEVSFNGPALPWQEAPEIYNIA